MPDSDRLVPQFAGIPDGQLALAYRVAAETVRRLASTPSSTARDAELLVQAEDCAVRFGEEMINRDLL